MKNKTWNRIFGCGFSMMLIAWLFLFTFRDYFGDAVTITVLWIGIIGCTLIVSSISTSSDSILRGV